jgi:hypothetical protein
MRLLACLAMFAIGLPALSASVGSASAAPALPPAARTTSSVILMDHKFPPDAVINVKTQFGAKGDGVTDDTQAIRTAIHTELGYNSQPKVLYFPTGTYLVSDTLDWHNLAGSWEDFITLQGESRYKTTIRLMDNAPGYADPTVPRAVILTASEAGTSDGGGNKGQNNFIQDLTVDTGHGNPGAIGIDYVANNRCAIRDVMIHSGDGSGVAGLNMTRYASGPCLFEDVAVDGFDKGVMIANLEYGLTFERLSLTHQNVVGLQDNDNVVTLHDLYSSNTVTAVMLGSRYGRPIALATIINGSLYGGSSAIGAINNGGNLYARNISTTGYHSVVTGLSGVTIAEYASSPAIGSAQSSLDLPIQETPLFTDYTPKDWVSVTSYGAQSNSGDATGPIQAAIDSGAPVVYFPLGSYRISRPLHLRGTTRALIGLESNLIGQGAGFNDPTAPLIMVESAPGTPVFIHGIFLFGPEANPGVVDASSATLVLQDVRFPTVAYHSTPGAGSLFIDDVDGGAWSFDYPQQVWARQLNSEPNAIKVNNHGATLWILGFKTEQPTTVMVTSAGGSSEVLGALLYPINPVDPSLPAFVSVDSSLSVVYATSAYTAGNNYASQVAITRGGVTQTLTNLQLPQRSLGSVASLFSSPSSDSYGALRGRRSGRATPT